MYICNYLYLRMHPNLSPASMAASSTAYRKCTHRPLSLKAEFAAVTSSCSTWPTYPAQDHQSNK